MASFMIQTACSHFYFGPSHTHSSLPFIFPARCSLSLNADEALPLGLKLQSKNQRRKVQEMVGFFLVFTAATQERSDRSGWRKGCGGDHAIPATHRVWSQSQPMSTKLRVSSHCPKQYVSRIASCLMCRLWGASSNHIPGKGPILRKKRILRMLWTPGGFASPFTTQPKSKRVKSSLTWSQGRQLFALKYFGTWHGNIKCWCSMFTVPKHKNMRRPIVNPGELSQVIQVKEKLQLPEPLTIISTAMKHMYAIKRDWRSWFSQIPLRAFSRPDFCVQFYHLVALRVLGQGFLLAPLFAHTLASILCTAIVVDWLPWIDDVIMFGDIPSEGQMADVSLEKECDLAGAVLKPKEHDATSQVVYVGFDLHMEKKLWRLDPTFCDRAKDKLVSIFFSSKLPISRWWVLIGSCMWAARVACTQIASTAGQDNGCLLFPSCFSPPTAMVTQFSNGMIN